MASAGGQGRRRPDLKGKVGRSRADTGVVTMRREQTANETLEFRCG
jgi:hypothetical protein